MGHLKLVACRADGDRRQGPVSIDPGGTVDALVRELHACALPDASLARRAALCIRELSQGRALAAQALLETVSALNDVASELEALKLRLDEAAL